MATSTATSGSSGSNNVLSDKVNRALNVRTDTPSMKAALDALSNLQVSNDNNNLKNKVAGSTNISTGGVIDAKSVRAAIEQDALRRALEFQTELQKLANDATVLRQRVDNVAKVADLVAKKVDSQIINVNDTAACTNIDGNRINLAT